MLARVTRKDLLRLQRFFIAKRKGKRFSPEMYRFGFAVAKELLQEHGWHTAIGVILTALAYCPSADWRFIKKHHWWLAERWKRSGDLTRDEIASFWAFCDAVDDD